MKMTNDLIRLEKSLNYAADFSGCDCGYISDIIHDIADNNTSIYYSDIMKFISKNPAALADVVREGWYQVEPGIEYDLYKHGQAAEYMTIYNEINENLSDYLYYTLLDSAANYDYFGVKLTDEECAALEELTAEPWKFDKLEELFEAAADIIPDEVNA